MTTKKKPSKYRNKRMEVDGIKFHSKKEAERWQVLKLLEQEGKIEGIRRQVRFNLYVNGQQIGAYVADFVYEYSIGSEVVEDVKSEFTRKNAAYTIKKKLMKAIYGIEITEI